MKQSYKCIRNIFIQFAGLFIHNVYLAFGNLKITYGVIVAHIMRPPGVTTS